MHRLGYGAIMRATFLYISVVRITSGSRVKFVDSKSFFTPAPHPVVYDTDRSQAVILVLFLFLCGFVGFATFATGRFMLSLAFLFVLVFCQSCLALWSPRLRKRELVYVFLVFCLFILC